MTIIHPAPNTAKIRLEMYCMVRYMGNPPELVNEDSSFQLSAFLRLEINRFSKVTSIAYNDSAAFWLKEQLRMQKERNGFRYKELDLLVKAEKLKNCSVVFPVLVELLVYEDGITRQLKPVPRNQFYFNGKPLGGVVWFGDDLVFYYNTRNRRKSAMEDRQRTEQ